MGRFLVLVRRQLCLGALLLLALASAHANTLDVSRVQVDGRDAPSAQGVLLREPGAPTARPVTLTQGQALPPGTELTLPRGAQVELTTSNGNIIRLYPGSRFQSGAVTARGESHLPLGGRIDFVVRKALDFFNIQYDRITAGVKGTEYTVEIDPAKSLTLRVTEGVVEVERKVHVKVAGSGEQKAVESDGIRVSEELKAGASRTYQLGAEEYLAEFKTYAEAEAYFLRALAQAEASGDKAQMLRAVQNLMEIYLELGKSAAALQLDSRCLQLAGAIISMQGEAACQNLAGVAYDDLGEYRKAIEYHERSLAMRQTLDAGREHPDIAASLNNLGNAYHALGVYRKAIDYHERSLAMSQALYAGRNHPYLAASLNNLGMAYYELGDNPKAVEYHERSLAMRQTLYAGREHPDIAASLTNLGIAYNRLGEHRKAIEYHERSLAMKQTLYAGRDHPDIADSLNNLGIAYRSLDEYRKAIEYHERSLAMKQTLYAGRDHPEIAGSLNNLGSAYHALGEYRKAIGYYEQSLDMFGRLYSDEHPFMPTALDSAAKSHESLGNTAKAAEYRERANAIRNRLKAK